jgi:hypothetical protein
MFLLAVSLARGVSVAQSFTFIPQDTILYGQLGSEIVFNCTIRNTSVQTLTLALIRTMNSLPQGWESSLCLTVCYPSTFDTILTTPEFGSSPLDPGESRPFSVHVYPTTNHGAGIVRILARNTRDPLDNRELTFTAISVQTGVAEEDDMPTGFGLEQNFPNPFNPTTTITFALPEASHVSLAIYDVLGRKIVDLVNGSKAAGYHSILWNASGSASGVYFVCFIASDGNGNIRLRKVNKLLLTK